MGLPQRTTRETRCEAMLMRLIKILALVVIVLLVTTGLAFFVYRETKESYLSVGLNSDVARAKYEVIAKVREHGDVVSCNSINKSVHRI